MARDKGSTPARRGPSRHARASFERQGSNASFASDDLHDSNAIMEEEDAPGLAAMMTHRHQQHIGEGMGGSTSRAAPSNGLSLGRLESRDGQQQMSYNNIDPASGLRITAPLAPPPAAAQPSPAPRGRGRPRKKPLESPAPSLSPSTPGAGAGSAFAVSGSATSPGGWNGNGEGQQIEGRNRQVGGSDHGRREEEGQEEGNESDEWSEEDDVHYLPTHIKAQFGNVVWAKYPPGSWPGIVWDPRFLGGDKKSRAVARLAYSALGKSHLVKFFDNSFAAIAYKNISPFDMADLPAHLKACGSAKKKEALKADTQIAFESAQRSRSERLADMHQVGRFAARKTPAKKPRKTKASKAKATVSKNDGDAERSSAASASSPALPPPSTGSARSAAPKKRGRGRPRKVPVKELDDDAPSSPSSGAEYELEIPSAKDEDVGDGVEDGRGAYRQDGDEAGVAEEEEADEFEEESEGGGGDDDDEEEYTADADPDADEEDDKLLDESFIKETAGRKRGRGRPSGGGRRRASSGSKATDPEEDDWDDNKTHKRPRQSAEDSDGGKGRGGKKKGKGIEPGEAKARALAVVQAYMAGLPPLEIGRDEGWTSSKDEARAGGGGGATTGGKRLREKEKGEGQGREKKPKASKISVKEGKLREENDRKQRLSEMKNSSEPVWKQARARMQEEQPATKERSKSADVKPKTLSIKPPAPAAAVGGGKEANIQRALKLTQRLVRASSESRFNKEDVLDLLRKLGELDPSVELLQQSGCGKAVAAVRKYYSGGQQVKHNDKDVATAASTLRARWMEALGKANAPNAPGSSSAPATPTGGGGGGGDMPSSAPTPTRARSEPAFVQPSSKKLPRSNSGRDSPRPSFFMADGRERARKSRDDGGRYGGSMADEEQGGSGRAGSGGDEKVADAANKKDTDAASAAVVNAEKKPPAVLLEEPRRRALGMLTAVLGTAAAAVERCTAIEQELYESQGKVVGDDYLRRLRTAVFSMDGSVAQRLRDKVMSEMVLPRDFVTKSADELRSLAGMV